MARRHVFVTGVDGVDLDSDSHQASARYRMLLPGRAVRDQGVSVAVWSVAGALDASAIGPRDRVTVMQLKADSKRSEERRRRYLALVEAAHARAGCLRFDISNFTDNFDELDRQVIALSDVVSVPSDGMRQVLENALGPSIAAKLTIIEDAYEMPRGEARFSPAPGLVRALWFGFPSAEHVAALCEAIRALEACARSTIVLDIVSAPGLAERCAQAFKSLARVRLHGTPWSVEATRRALTACDLVLLPGAAVPSTLAKSHNRLVEVLRSGRLALCAPLPAYCELADYCCIGDIAEGLAWALDHPGDALDRIRAGQAHVEARFAPAVLAAKWIALADRIAAERGKED